MKHMDKRDHMTGMNRRDVLRVAVGGTAALTIATGGIAQAQTPERKGRIKQGICGFWRGKMPMERLFEECKRLGIVAMDFIKPEEWAELKKHGIVCSMTGSHGL